MCSSKRRCAACTTLGLPSPYRSTAVLAKSKALFTEPMKFGTAYERESQCMSPREDQGKGTEARTFHPPSNLSPYKCTPHEAEQSYRALLLTQIQAPDHIAELALVVSFCGKVSGLLHQQWQYRMMIGLCSRGCFARHWWVDAGDYRDAKLKWGAKTLEVPCRSAAAEFGRTRAVFKWLASKTQSLSSLPVSTSFILLLVLILVFVSLV